MSPQNSFPLWSSIVNSEELRVASNLVILLFKFGMISIEEAYSISQDLEDRVIYGENLL